MGPRQALCFIYIYSCSACSLRFKMSEVDDLTQLKHLNEEILIDCLHKRFDMDKIYTMTGPVLLAINPFRSIDGLYDVGVFESYRRGATRPHVFSIAEHAYLGMEKSSQSILISGESGSGKTETAKLVMRYMSHGASTLVVERQILESNPLLEAFGNAQTLRNNNSSRFGKFIQLQFAPLGASTQLVGAKIETYLLEKVRVCFQSPGERNFHIFYQCCAAAASVGGVVYPFPQLLNSAGSKQLTLRLNGFADMAMFKYLSGLPHEDDLLGFEQTVEAMCAIGMGVSDIQTVFSAVAAILHIGNIEFNTTADNETCFVCEKSSLFMACALLGIDDPGLLETALTQRTICISGEESVYANLSCAKARETRDALARFLYGVVFKHLVDRTNLAIDKTRVASKTTSLLDIFGFEYFQKNSFEQLCINFANEKLHGIFTEFFLRGEQLVYESEGLVWSRTEFPDNACIIGLLGGPSGVLPMLDEECRVVGGSDRNLLAKLHKQHAISPNYAVVKTNLAELFVIQHFAGPVVYTVASFVDKNKEREAGEVWLGSEVVKALLGNSELLKGARGERGIFKAKQYTVSGEFREQLDNLVSTISASNLSFIRCIKPNHRNVGHLFDAAVVGDQLRYGGVLQAVAISRAGFAVRIPHSEFLSEFRSLSDLGLNNLPSKHLCANLIRNLRINATLGKTRIFFKQVDFDHLVALRTSVYKRAALLIQAFYRRHRGVKAATRIQAAFRGHQIRTAYLYFCSCVVLIQRFARKRFGNSLERQMAALGAELRAAKASMRTFESFQKLPYHRRSSARFSLVPRGIENVAPRVRTASQQNVFASPPAIKQRVMDEMEKMRQLIDKMEMSDN